MCFVESIFLYTAATITKLEDKRISLDESIFIINSIRNRLETSADQDNIIIIFIEFLETYFLLYIFQAIVIIMMLEYVYEYSYHEVIEAILNTCDKIKIFESETSVVTAR